MLFQLNPSSSMIINRARLTSAAGETRDRVNDTNARRSSLVRLKTDCMLHIVLLKSMLHNTSCFPFRAGRRADSLLLGRWVYELILQKVMDCILVLGCLLRCYAPGYRVGSGVRTRDFETATQGNAGSNANDGGAD